MTYQELMAVPLPSLANRALNGWLLPAARLDVLEIMESRAAEIWEAGAWLGYSDPERAVLRAAFAIDVEALAARIPTNAA